jgi:hypothetical protein
LNDTGWYIYLPFNLPPTPRSQTSLSNTLPFS